MAFRWAAVRAVAALWAIGACKGGPAPSGVTAPPPAVASITVTPKLVNVRPGDTVQLTAVAKDGSGQVLSGRTISWVSSAPTVATVSSTGLFAALRNGQTQIAATAEGQTGSAAATVGLVFTALAVGTWHTCGLTIASTLYCWGDNTWGALGTGPATGPEMCGGTTPCSTAPVPVAGRETFASVTAGRGFTCAVTLSGDGRCWGLDSTGQFGSGALGTSDTPVAAAGGLGLTTMSAGSDHTCAITLSASLYCWGGNLDGQLGDSTTTNRLVPVRVMGPSTWAAVSAGRAYTCGLAVGGAAFCWGFGSYGQLGYGSAGSKQTPAAVATSAALTSVSAGYQHTCAVATGGLAYCWGQNTSGELGDSTFLDRSAPVAVVGGLRFSAISAGYNSTCALTTSGAAYCWGWTQTSTAPGTSIPAPVPFAAIFTFRAIQLSSAFHGCGVTTADVAYCWGAGTLGQRGDSTTANSYIPIKVARQF